jgi:hypothetical protein
MRASFVWRPRSVPLSPVAVVAEGAVGRALVRRLLSGDAETLTRLQGAFLRDTLILLGAESDLPWVDGVLYLGRDPAAPSLLLPTNLEPSIPVTLLERALRQQAKELAPPLAVLPAQKTLIAVGAARTVVRETLERWLANYP